MIRDAAALLVRLREIQAHIRDTVVAETERSAIESLSAPVGDDAGDTIFAIDRVSEEALLAQFEALAHTWPLRLVAEGLGETGVRELGGRAPEIVVIVDPIDGTRGLMYQKRPAWVLTGVAPFGEHPTRLSDIELAIQTEIPLVKQHLCDSLWVLDEAVGGERYNRLTGERQPLRPTPTRARDIQQGFGNISRFFPGTRGLLAEIDDALIARLLGEPPPGRAQAFEDQYISSGGQLYELLMGHDRWVADLRPLIWRRKGVRGLCCHPYDLCTERIARAAGIAVTDERGQPLSAPLDVDSDVAWIGYANPLIQTQVEPVLRQLLVEHGLADHPLNDPP